MFADSKMRADHEQICMDKISMLQERNRELRMEVDVLRQGPDDETLELRAQVSAKEQTLAKRRTDLEAQMRDLELVAKISLEVGFSRFLRTDWVFRGGGILI